MKLTRHNGRAGKNGVYNPKHNDRSFDIANSEHIDEERAKQNLYWDCYNGFRNFKNPEKENELSATFEDVEQLFYRQRYHDFVTGQNERNVKNRHPERNKETGDLLKSKKTCPEETVYQIGTLDNHVPPELLIEIVTEFMEIVNERFGSHVHILNWALHLDESTPHIHERHVFDCENQYGGEKAWLTTGRRTGIWWSCLSGKTGLYPFQAKGATGSTGAKVGRTHDED